MKRVIVDQSKWGLLRVTGADRVRFVQGMVTNDVAALAPGGWTRASILNVKGRVLAVVDVVAEPEALVVITEPVTAAKVKEPLEKHAIIDDVTFTPFEADLHRIWDDPESVWTAPPVFAPPPEAASSEDEVEIRRIEGGLPRYGVDVSEDHFPFEAHLEPGISYTKGCYIGQVVVARAHARGHANRGLRGLLLDGDGVASASDVIATADRPDAGQITSSVVSPDFGAIALGYVHKSAWDAGMRVRVGAAGREATVATLPFSGAARRG
jgi:folate-binding protein YgfZ